MPVIGFWIWCELGPRFDAQIEGNFRPRWFSTSFDVNHLKLDWNDKVRIESGNLKVQYDLVSLFKGGGLRVQLSGSEIPVVLLGSWAQASSRPDVTLDHFFADLTLTRGGIRDIHRVEAHSPELKFYIGKNT